MAIHGAAGAQNAQDRARAGRQADQIQREEQERLRRQLEEERDRARSPGVEIPVPPTKAPNLGAPCRHISEIVVEGAPNLSDSARDELIGPYLNRCLTGSDIEKLLSDLTAHYVTRGFLTSRVYIPKQDLSGGTLRILVVEGVVERIRIEDDDRNSVNPHTAFPGREGEPFNIRDFEQGIEQLNRLASNNATLDIEPGEQPGGSVIVIRNQPRAPWAVSLYGDNTGMVATGRRQVGAYLSYDNLLGLNDYIGLSLRRSDPVYGEEKESNSNSLTLSVPWGYNTLTANLSKSDYRSHIGTSAGPLRTDGRTDSASLILDRVLMRGADYRLGGSLGLNFKDTKSYVAQELIETSSRKLATLDVDVNANTGLMGGIITVGLGYTRGTKLMGALYDDPILPDDFAHAQFDKWRYTANWAKPFAVSDYQASFTTALTGQHAHQVLYGSEQLSATGYTAVRGFNSTSLAGDRGWYVRNDLAVTVPLWPDQALSLKPHIGLDAGKILDRNGVPGGWVSGWAAGATVSAGPVSLDITYTDQLYRPASLEPENGFAFVKLTTSF